MSSLTFPMDSETVLAKINKSPPVVAALCNTASTNSEFYPVGFQISKN